VSEATEASGFNEGLLLNGLEKSLMDYLTQNQNDRYLTLSRLSLALGSNELLLKRALRSLIGYHLVIERETDAGDTTFHKSGNQNDEEPSQTPKVVTPEPTVTEKDVPVQKVDATTEQSGISCPKCGSKDCIGNGHRKTNKGLVARHICKACDFRFSEGRVYPRVGRPKGQSKESAKLDVKIKELYPAMQMDEIATSLGVDYGTVRGRITRLRQRGEISEYSHYPAKPNSPIGKKPSSKSLSTGVSKPPRNPVGIPEKTVGSFNIGQLLKVSSENQVAVVSATLEVIDESNSQYEVTITRKGKGVGGRGPVALEFGVDVWKQLDDILDYHGDYLRDRVKDESIKEDDPEVHEIYVRQLEAMKVMRSKIARDVGISEEEEKVK